jgi:VWA domain-containing protein
MKHSSDVVAARVRACLVLLIAAIVVAGAHAQEQITFFLSATSLTGENVADLKAEDVAVAEDGKPTSVVRMVPVNWPVKVTVLVDNGFDTGQLLSQYRSGLKSFLAALPAGVEASVLTLAPQPRWLIRPTSDAEQLQKSIDRLVPDQASSRMVEGLIEVAGRIEQENRKQVVHFPVIVVLSTTGPEGSTARENEVNKMATQLLTYPARVHVIMLSTGATSNTSLVGARQVHVGKSVADLTGGRYEAIAASTRIPSLLVEFAETIGEAHAFQSHQYMVTVQRPAGASGTLGQMMAGPTRTGVRLTPTSRGLKP